MSSIDPTAPKLTRNPVLPTLFTMALPMLGGTFAMNAFNLTDTWFVAQLGTLPLSFVGGALFGLDGIFWGRAAADIIAGCVGMIWANTVLKRVIHQTEILK